MSNLQSFVFKDNILSDYLIQLKKGAWIVKWSSHSTFEHWYATPWAVRLSLGDDNLFFGPKNNIYALFMILFGLFD